MKTRSLGDLQVYEIGMGCMGFSHGYGKIPDEKYRIQAIQDAYDYGCTFFDTAEVYSPNMEGIKYNELIVGKALHGVRNNVVLATKLYLPTDEAKTNGVYQALRRHLEDSMQRTDPHSKTKRRQGIDIYYKGIGVLEISKIYASRQE